MLLVLWSTAFSLVSLVSVAVVVIYLCFFCCEADCLRVRQDPTLDPELAGSTSNSGEQLFFFFTPKRKAKAEYQNRYPAPIVLPRSHHPMLTHGSQIDSHAIWIVTFTTPSIQHVTFRSRYHRRTTRQSSSPPTLELYSSCPFLKFTPGGQSDDTITTKQIRLDDEG